VEETQTLAEKLRQTLDDYTSYNGHNLNPVFLYMREAERFLKTNKDSENSNKKLENLVLACKRKIVENNLGLLIEIAKFYTGVTGERSYYDDFLQEGKIGLLNAIPGYKPEKGKFSNYAAVAIRQNIIRRMQEILGNIRLPINILHYQKHMDYFFRLFEEKHGRIPSDEELAEFSGKKVRSIKALRRAHTLSHTASLDAVFYEKDRKCLMDYVCYDRNYSMEEEEVRKMMCQELINCINKLSDKKSRRVLIGRLEGKTLQEIGLEENLTKERIRQIENKAMKKIRTMREFKVLKKD